MRQDTLVYIIADLLNVWFETENRLLDSHICFKMFHYHKSCGLWEMPLQA